MGHVNANPLPKGTGYRVRGVDPAVCVEHIFRDVFCMHAVDWVADILPRRHDEREGQHEHHGDGVVEPEDGRVYRHMALFDQGLETPEHVQHGAGGAVVAVVFVK